MVGNLETAHKFRYDCVGLGLIENYYSNTYAPIVQLQGDVQFAEAEKLCQPSNNIIALLPFYRGSPLFSFKQVSSPATVSPVFSSHSTLNSAPIAISELAHAAYRLKTHKACGVDAISSAELFKL